jgi:hypothetical protein
MKGFLGWNDAVAKYFFRPENAGRTVYLYATPELIQELGEGEGLHNFIEVLRNGPPWTTKRGLCQNALHAMQGWRTRGLEFPPYVGYLALFVLAAGFEGDWQSHAYYPRLRALLGEPDAPNYPSFGRMWELWMDLEAWLKERDGALGIIRTDLAGDTASEMVHVNYPVSQAILTESERTSLHEVFASADLDPDDPPSDMELARAIRSAGTGRLRARTLRALAAKQRDSDFTAVVIDRILEELESWDGESQLSGDEENRSRRGTAIVCLTKDAIAKQVRLELRCHFSEPFPPQVIITHEGREFSCRELANGLSTPFVEKSGAKLNPMQFDWTARLLLTSQDETISLRAPGSDVRLFTDASSRGLNGHIEVRAFDPKRPFVLAVSPRAASLVQDWGQKSCARFEVQAFAGLPAKWTLFSGDSAADDALIREQLPQLSFSHKLRRIRVELGLRIPGTQFYFRFAPPVVRLDGASEGAEVRFNDLLVERDPDGTFNIPEDLLGHNVVSVKCVDTGKELQRTIYLRDGAEAAEWSRRCYSPFGSILENAILEDFLPCGIPSRSTEGLAASTWMKPIATGARATLIGQAPGEIAAAGSSVPWQAVWRISHHGRRATVEYVAPTLLPPVTVSHHNHRALRDWKEALWHHRKRIDPPAFEPLRKLWAAYQDAAKNA